MTLNEPSPGSVTTPRQPPPQLLLPERMGSPFESRAKFHIIAVRPQFSRLPTHLSDQSIRPRVRGRVLIHEVKPTICLCTTTDTCLRFPNTLHEEKSYLHVTPPISAQSTATLSLVYLLAWECIVEESLVGYISRITVERGTRESTSCRVHLHRTKIVEQSERKWTENQLIKD